MRTFTLSDFDFALPPELIAQHPAPSAAPRACWTAPAHAGGPHLSRPALAAAPGDLLVFNDTKVVKARLFGEKPTGGKVELLIERVLPGNQVVAHMRSARSRRWAPRWRCMAGGCHGHAAGPLAGCRRRAVPLVFHVPTPTR
jgi:S-adenosylmethionine:tRNA ribosyltransferase-isomerase